MFVLRTKWGASLKQLFQMTTFAIIMLLLVTGHLPDMNDDASLGAICSLSEPVNKGSLHE